MTRGAREDWILGLGRSPSAKLSAPSEAPPRGLSAASGASPLEVARFFAAGRKRLLANELRASWGWTASSMLRLGDDTFPQGWNDGPDRHAYVVYASVSRPVVVVGVHTPTPSLRLATLILGVERHRLDLMSSVLRYRPLGLAAPGTVGNIGRRMVYPGQTITAQVSLPRVCSVHPDCRDPRARLPGGLAVACAAEARPDVYVRVMFPSSDDAGLR